jgi:hypothetical protein
MSINIDDLTLGQVKELKGLGGATMNDVGNPTPFHVGKCYLIRTVTMTWTGQVVTTQGGFLVLDSAAWIADTGRYNEAIRDGKLNEVEPVYGQAIVSLGSIVDAVEWKHALPQTVK